MYLNIKNLSYSKTHTDKILYKEIAKQMKRCQIYANYHI